MTTYTTYRTIDGRKFERVNGHKTKAEAQKYAKMIHPVNPKWLIRVIEDPKSKFSMNNHWGTYVHMPRNNGTMYGR
jgi:hypothetical protein